MDNINTPSSTKAGVSRKNIWFIAGALFFVAAIAGFIGGSTIVGGGMIAIAAAMVVMAFTQS